MPGMTRRRPPKCFGDSASQYKMISFHLPPIAASAPVSGHPPTGLARPGRGLGRLELPGGAFLMERISQIIVLPDAARTQIIS